MAVPLKIGTVIRYFTAYDNVTNFFNLLQPELQLSTIKIVHHTSFTRKDDRSMIPNTNLTRTSVLTRAVSRFGKDERCRWMPRYST